MTFDLGRFKSDLPYVPTPDNNKIGNYVETDFQYYIENQFIIKRMGSGLDVRSQKVKIVPVSDYISKIHSMLGIKALIIQINDRCAYIESDSMQVSINKNHNSITISILGDLDQITILKNKIVEYFDVISTSIEWITSKDMNSTSIPLIAPKGIFDSNYPFVEGGVNNFIDAYLQSTENILILIGEPGTGKSNFIKNIIARSGKDSVVTYDPAIMQSDGIFAFFMEGNYGSLIMEDADTFLTSRSDGNQFMNKFLNVSDGIVSMSSKKIIFSTNLDNLESVDFALTRPGRCHAVVPFRKLTGDEVEIFIKDHNMDRENIEPGKSYTLAEIYNSSARHRKTQKRSVGFL